MTTQNKNVPALRFAEFNEDWKETQIGRDITLISGQHILAENYSEKSDGVPYLTGPTDFQSGKIIATKFTKKPKSLCKENDILITVKGSGTGTLVKADKEYCISRQLMAIRPKTWNSDYLYFVMFSQTENFNQISVGLIPGISRDDILHRKLLIPSVPEQQKIAAFLTAVDEKIQQLARKKDFLEQYKKGVMQKIFNQEIRFKDAGGNDFADWEEKKLGEVASVTMGQSPDSKSYNSDGIGKYLIQGNADISNRKSNPRNWTSEPTKECKIGDLLLTVRAPVGAIAKSDHNACIGRGVCSIRNNSKSNIEFLYQFFLDYEPKWIRLEQGSTFTAVNGNDIKSIKLNLPSIDEQKKIAAFLSAIDEKINLAGRQLEKTKEYKKGLLQQMFV